jgi:hypothetical protein
MQGNRSIDPDHGDFQLCCKVAGVIDSNKGSVFGGRPAADFRIPLPITSGRQFGRFHDRVIMPQATNREQTSFSLLAGAEQVAARPPTP